MDFPVWAPTTSIAAFPFVRDSSSRLDYNQSTWVRGDRHGGYVVYSCNI